MKVKKKFWVVAWRDKTGYNEFVELWSTEREAQEAADDYQESWGDILDYYIDEIELIK